MQSTIHPRRNLLGFCQRIPKLPWHGAVLFFAVSMIAGPALLAQTTSTIEGTLTDRQGLLISGAEVTVTADTLAVSRKTITDTNGNYQITALPAGIYSLTLSHAGFSTHVLRDLEITLNRTFRFNVSLEVGTVQQRVEVYAEAQPSFLPRSSTCLSTAGITWI